MKRPDNRFRRDLRRRRFLCGFLIHKGNVDAEVVVSKDGTKALFVLKDLGPVEEEK